MPLTVSGSTPSTASWPPSTCSKVPKRTPVATSTSGTRLRSRATSGGRPPWLKVPESTTKSPVKASSMIWSIDALVEAAKMVMKPTRLTPIVSAAAVDDVRFGLRMAFSRARLPGMPRRRAMGQPSSELTGRATTGPMTAPPM
jgi:hypothetical protein